MSQYSLCARHGRGQQQQPCWRPSSKGSHLPLHMPTKTMNCTRLHKGCIYQANLPTSLHMSQACSSPSACPPQATWQAPVALAHSRTTLPPAAPHNMHVSLPSNIEGTGSRLWESSLRANVNHNHCKEMGASTDRGCVQSVQVIRREPTCLNFLLEILSIRFREPLLDDCRSLLNLHDTSV